MGTVSVFNDGVQPASWDLPMLYADEYQSWLSRHD
jgi:hypothetical protein